MSQIILKNLIKLQNQIQLVMDINLIGQLSMKMNQDKILEKKKLEMT